MSYDSGLVESLNVICISPRKTAVGFEFASSEQEVERIMFCDRAIDTPLERRRGTPRRKVAAFGVTALATLAAASAAALGQSAAWREGLERRYAVLDRLEYEYDWLQTRSPGDADPTDESRWHVAERYGVTFRSRWRARFVRPHFQFELLSASDSNAASWIHTWIDNRRLSRYEGKNGEFVVTIDKSPAGIFGPVPMLTPFEFQLFDVQDTIADFVSQPSLRAHTLENGFVRLEGGSVIDRPDVPWQISVDFDPARGFVPVAMRLGVQVDAKNRFDWTLKALETQPVVDGVHVIREALIWLKTDIDPSRWQIYRFRATRVRHAPELSKDWLVVEVPNRNVKISNLVDGVFQTLDRDGIIVNDQRMTQEEIRDAQYRFQLTLAMSNDKRAQLRWRQQVMIGITIGAAIVALLVGWIWLWKRRSYYRRLRSAA